MLKVWQHQTEHFSIENASFLVQYKGRSEKLGILKGLLGADDEEQVRPELTPLVHVCELPKAGAIHIPASFNTVVPLDRPLDDIVATYAKSLRRALKKQLARYSYQLVTNPAQIRQINSTMLRPYAIARNGEAAHHFSDKEVVAMALAHGAMYLLLDAGEPVGCHLGNAFVEKGSSYWHVNRFGYIDRVFNDYKLLQEANSANLHLALMKAIENNYDFCDYGFSTARPGNGLLEWKRRRKGLLKHNCSDTRFYLLPPSNHEVAFFWKNPLFGLEGSDITLHLGLPNDIEPEAVLERYKEMGYDGLKKVYCYANQPPQTTLISGLQKLYENLSFRPEIVTKILK